MNLQGSYVRMPGTGQAGIHGSDTVLGQLLEGYTLYIYSLGIHICFPLMNLTPDQTDRGIG